MTGLISTISILLWSSPYAWSQATLDASANPLGYVARINNDSPAEVADSLKLAEKFYLYGKLAELSDPLSIVLHVPAVEFFFNAKYTQYKDIVDLAARLSAFGVINLLSLIQFGRCRRSTRCRFRWSPYHENKTLYHLFSPIFTHSI